MLIQAYTRHREKRPTRASAADQGVRPTKAFKILLDSDLEIRQSIDVKPGEIRCPRCRGHDIVPSLPRGIRDDIMFGMGRVPRHCRSCGRRFYVPAPPEVESEP
jgi:hypothetical protein